MPPKELEIKGQAFHSVFAAVEHLYGIEGRSKVSDNLTGDFGATASSGLLMAGGWYPVGWYRALLREAQELNPDPLLAKTIGLVSGRREVTGLYRVMFRMLSTETLIGQAPRFFRMFYRGGGECELVDSSSNRAQVRYRGCVGFDRRVWLDLIGGCQAGLEHTGAKNVLMNAASGGRDTDHLTLDVRWT